MSILVDQYGKPLKASRKVRNSLENPRTSLSDPDEWLLDSLGGGATDAGVHVNRKTAIGYPPLWRGINLISGDVGKLPLYVYKRRGDDGKDVSDSHPAYRLMRRKPNPWMTALVFKRTLTYHALLFGNGYAGIFRSLRTPVELMILSPTDTFPLQVDGRLWYVTKVGNEQRRIPAEDVLHIRGLSFDGLQGHSVLEVMAEALGLGMAAREYGARFFGEGSNMAGILMVPGKFKQEQIRNAIQSWEEMSKGLKRSHKVALLQDGVKWQPTTISPEQGQFNETRQFEIREVANILGVPPHKLGDQTRNSYNSLEQENKSYLQDCLDQWLCAWEDECYDKLLSEREKEADSHFFEYLREAYIQTDGEKKIAMLINQVNNGLLTPDEARAILNLPAYPDGEGEKFRMPSNLAIVGEEPEPTPAMPEAPQPTEPPADDDSDDEEDERLPTDALNAAHRTIIANDLQRMVRRLSSEAKQKAKQPESLASWLQSFESEHGPTVVEVVRDGIVAHCVASRRPESAEPITAWAVTQLFSAYREDLGVTLSSDGDVPMKIHAMADRFERDLAMQIAETITQGAQP